MKTTLTLLALTACTAAAPRAPVVYIHDSDGDPALRAQYLDAAAGWSPLGFEFTFDDPGLSDCYASGHAWRAGDDPNCTISVWLFRVPNLVGEGNTQALTDPATRAISIDTSLTGWKLSIATAHELGHVVLNTAQHTQGGIMGGVDDRMWGVDRQLACNTVGVCL